MSRKKHSILSASETDLLASPENDLWNLLADMAGKSANLLVKKLSRNDTSWADDSGKHQAGFYIPSAIRESEFFPPLVVVSPEKSHIFRAACRTLWPQSGEVGLSNMSHYSNKGPETHFTVVPKQLFRGLAPASLLVGGRLRKPIAEATHWFIVLDSTSEEAELLETALDLDAEFHFALFAPEDIASAASLERGELEELIDRLKRALSDGSLESLLSDYARIPTPEQIANEARTRWLQENRRTNFDPYTITAPGDAIMRISRDLEYRIFRKHELRHRAIAVVRILTRDHDLVSAVVRGFPDLDQTFLSASQQRKTRAGRSFEHHIAAALRDGRIRFQEQAVTGGRRPDFVLPDTPTLKRKRRDFNGAMVIAAKTTLRERWKQVSSEGLNCPVFLATVDDRVAATTISEMASCGITLVVPESLKNNTESFYKNNSNVISFRSLFDDEIRRNRPFLLYAT